LISGITTDWRQKVGHQQLQAGEPTRVIFIVMSKEQNLVAGFAMFSQPFGRCKSTCFQPVQAAACASADTSAAQLAGRQN
jgi:hypothetical protein